MREMKYRGQLDDDLDFYEIDLHLKKGDWVYGNLITNDGVPYIVGDIMDCDSDYIVLEFWYPVIPKTVGQYIDWEDKNDKEIYEGDILMTKDLDTNNVYIGVVDYNNASFYIESDLISLYRWDDYEVEIIGNIHDNPELLEVKE